MGGMGSGSWYRWNTKTTTEETKRIDIRYMKKQGWLEPGGWRSMSWSRGGEPSGNINYRVDNEGLSLSYRFRSHGSDWEDMKERVYFVRTACNYGGERLWFLCPHCGKRVGVLYGADTRFLCRHCYDLSYASQAKGYLERMIDQKHKLGDRIFDDYSGYGRRKRKGMQQKTFDRLYRKYCWLDMKIDGGIAERFGSFMGSL